MENPDREAVMLGVVAGLVVATLVAVAVCGNAQDAARTDNDIFGLATRHGVCARPQLASQLHQDTRRALRVMPPFAAYSGDEYGMEYANFKGVAYVMIDDKVDLARTDLDDRLVEVGDVRQLTPCAPDDRWQCTTEDGNVEFADGSSVRHEANERFQVHAPWRYRDHMHTWVTAKDGRAAMLHTLMGRCDD